MNNFNIKHKEFQDDLKYGDILWIKITIIPIVYYKFIEFYKCPYQQNSNFKSICKNCKGSYKLLNLKNNKFQYHSGCYTWEKFEEFITEEEFSV